MHVYINILNKYNSKRSNIKICVRDSSAENCETRQPIPCKQEALMMSRCFI